LYIYKALLGAHWLYCSNPW